MGDGGISEVCDGGSGTSTGAGAGDVVDSLVVIVVARGPKRGWTLPVWDDVATKSYLVATSVACEFVVSEQRIKNQPQ